MFHLKLISVVALLAYGTSGQTDFDLESFHEADAAGKSCTDDRGNPQMCQPSFVNVAYHQIITVTNTCGMPPYRTEFCVQSAAGDKPRRCDFCDNNVEHLRHPPEYLTDIDNNEHVTWWQSETMYENVQYPNSVNLTLKLPKAFEITYVNIKFHSPRPESFAIYKKVSDDGDWIPFQYYSADCRGVYVPESNYIRPGKDETKAMCTSDYSDISPLSGGVVAFSTLAGRPSRYEFENSKPLQDWVTATEVKISLDRMNTFGDEVFESPQVLKSYYYAISDLAIGGRCKCNGHASECVTTGDPNEKRWYCSCEHHTAGPDCNECQPLYNDRPWARATSEDAHECKACHCNGLSDRCFFDAELYNRTGHGGHCTDCKKNRDGPNCERCKPDYYGGPDQWCYPCHCNPTGSRSLQCNSEGNCQCKPGVTGAKCDQCEVNYYDFTVAGCKPCECSVPGSLHNRPSCDPRTGICECKENVEGQRCDKCKPGYFHLDTGNEFGCTPCFCFGRSSVCQPASGYGQVLLESTFARGKDRWMVEDGETGRLVEPQYNGVVQNIGAAAEGQDPVFFVAPDRFLGDQRGSYNQVLNFTLRIFEPSARVSGEDVIIEGGGRRISQSIFQNGNQMPSLHPQTFSYRLHENKQFGWNPRLSPQDFISVLSNVTKIKIRATYNPQGRGLLDDVMLKTARRGAAGPPAPWVESCTCPEGYIGQFCESCAPNYTRERKNGGPFSRCVPCTCNGHADMCDSESGQCICQDNTAGEHCERCARGFYGNSLKGTENDCQSCPCPNNGACIQLADSQIVCLECPTGYAGPLCEYCGDGFYGDPSGLLGPKTECRPCDCNENIDPNAVGNCNRTTGECIKCIYNTGGPRCDHCLPGFFGDALSPTKGDCRHCQCNPLGTVPTADGNFVCEQPLGQCPCRSHVVGRQCDVCEEGFFNLSSGEGCSACDCDPIGSFNATCDAFSGQCYCRPGIWGQKCNECIPNYYGFSTEGCKPCACDGIGSTSAQCDADGQCPCLPNVEGRQCDRCKENKRNRHRGCEPCPECYNLVQEAVDKQRAQLNEMEQTLQKIKNTPIVIDDTEFDSKLNQVKQQIENLYNDAKASTGQEDGKGILDQIKELEDKVTLLDTTAAEIKQSLKDTENLAEEINVNITVADGIIQDVDEKIKTQQRYLDSEGAAALTDAREQVKTTGQKNTQLSDLTKEARALAEKHEADAKEIEETAQKALNISTKALDTFYTASTEVRDAKDNQVRTLQGHIRMLEDEVRSTETRANESLKLAKEAYDQALSSYRDATSLSLPQVDLESIKEAAKRAKDDALEVKRKTTELLERRKQALEQAHKTIEEVTPVVEAAESNQKGAKDILEDLDVAKREAAKVENTSQSAYKNAEDILHTLEDFNEQVDVMKEKARVAKQQFESIGLSIQESEIEIPELRRVISASERQATQALRDAEEALEIAEKASKDATEVSQDAMSAKVKSADLKGEVEDQNTRIEDLDGRLSASETTIAESDEQVRGALEKASDAKSKAMEAHVKVQKALDDVRDIALALDNLQEINQEGLVALETQVQEVETAVRQSGLDEKLEALRQARNKQEQWLKQSEEERDALAAEVANIRAIRDKLPPTDQCFATAKLEP